MRRISIVVALILAFSFYGLPQLAPPTGNIQGIVVRSDTSQPIANAQVALSSVLEAERIAGLDAQIATGNTAVAPRPDQIAPVTTGTDGTFSFKDLQPGAYRLMATANGFVRQEYGQRALYGQGRVLYLAAGQAFRDATVRLTPTGTVSGRVYDEMGQPATGATVQLLRAVFNAGGNRNYGVVKNTAVDDRGDYRLFGIAPGRYYLVAGTPPGPGVLRGFCGPGATAARFSTVYYPNTTKLEQASPIEVKAVGEVTFDLRVARQVKTFRISGRVVDGTGAGIPADLNIMLGWSSFNSLGAMVGSRTIDAATGAFEMPNVPPGEWSVQARVPPAPGRGGAGALAEQASQPSASVPIQVVDSDIEGLVLTLRTGAVIDGRVVVDGKPLSSVPNLASLRISFNSSELGSGMPAIPGTAPAATGIAADGTFQVKGMREGRYRFQMSVPGFYVKSVKYGGDEIVGQVFEFSGIASGTLEVTLRAAIATVSGTVVDGNAQPVPGVNVVFAPSERNRSELLRTVLTDQNGRYSMANLAPGEYKAFSWESIDSNAYFDPEFVKHFEQLGKTIVVSESTNPTVGLKLIPAE